MLNKIIDRIKLPFRKEKELYLSLYNIIGVLPHNLSFYKTALLHKSVARRNDKGKPVNNERLEFLGDAILDAIVGDIVYEHFPGKREGFLTNTRLPWWQCIRGFSGCIISRPWIHSLYEVYEETNIRRTYKH